MAIENLTIRTVRSAAYRDDGSGRDVRWDAEVPGFGLRLYPSGKPSFVLSYRAKGRKRKLATAVSRRHLVGGSFILAGASLAAGVPGAAAALLPTPLQGEGPFYPYTLPLDSDADLATVVGHPQRALGEIAHIAGRVWSEAAQPIPGVTVEIWQCDAMSQYTMLAVAASLTRASKGLEGP